MPIESNTVTDLPSRMTIFRAENAPSLDQAKCMDIEDVSPLVGEYITKLSAAGIGEGEEVKVLFNAPGFSLTYAWFKRNFPLPLHTHNAHCLYYIIAGSLKLGTETLGHGDGFFVPEGVPYTYTPGPNGVEVIEFRHAQHFNIKFMAKTMPFWEKAIEKVRAETPEWAVAKPPHLVETGQ